MNHIQLIAFQKQWIDKLVQLNLGRPLYGQYLEGRINDFHKEWIPLTRDDIVMTRQVLNNEVVFDFDYQEWKDVRRASRKLVEYLEERKIPYIIASTGGKGIHIHLFLDIHSVEIDEELLNGSYEKSVDVMRAIRIAVFHAIVEKAKLKVGERTSPEGLDLRKVNFSTRSVVRDFGCPRPDGNAKTVIITIPQDKPKCPIDQVVFPGDIELVDLARWKGLIEQQIKLESAAMEKASHATPVTITGRAISIPCYRKLLGGVQTGFRNETVFALGRLAAMVNCPVEETINDMKIFCRNSNMKEDEASSTIFSAYKYESKKKKRICGSMIYNFGSEICDRNNCPIEKEKRKELVNINE